MGARVARPHAPGGPSPQPSWSTNPHYWITVSNDAQLTVELSQRDERAVAPEHELVRGQVEEQRTKLSNIDREQKTLKQQEELVASQQQALAMQQEWNADLAQQIADLQAGKSGGGTGTALEA